MSSALGDDGLTVALSPPMLSNSFRFRSASIVFAALILPAASADAQVPDRLLSKLDSRLSSSVRARQSDTKRVIIRTTSDGIPQLTDALKGNRRFVRRHHATINALAADVPVSELESLSKLPFVESISEDAIVSAEQTSSEAPTLRGTLGLPVLSPTGYGGPKRRVRPWHSRRGPDRRQWSAVRRALPRSRTEGAARRAESPR